MISARQLLTSPRGRWLAGAAAALLLVAAGVLVYLKVTSLPGDAVLRYGDEVVTESELEERVDTLQALYGISRPDDGDALDEFNRDIAKSLAVSLILDEAARDEDIVISEKSARDTLGAMLEAQLGPDPQQAFQELLTEFGVNEDDILEEVSRQQAIARLFKTVTQDAVDAVTSTDARERFDEDPSAFALPEQRTISNIVVGTRKEARAAMNAIRQGTAFADVARERSLDDATRADGGALGNVLRSDLESAYAEAAFGVGEGELFGPVQTAYGWNVGVVGSVSPSRRLPFEQVSDDALDLVRSERAMEAWRSWLAERIKDADVEYADAYEPANPDEPPAEAVDPVESVQ